MDELNVISRVGAACSGFPGRITKESSCCSGPESEPDLASRSFTPKGMMGSVSSIASDSSFVRAFENVEAFQIERNAHVFRRGKIVVHDGRYRHFVSLTEEPRHRQPHHQVFPYADAIDGAADPRICRDPAHGCPPRRQRIWER